MASKANFLAALLLAGCHAGAHAVQDCEIGGVPVNPANGATTAGKSGLMRCRDRDSGLLQREQQVQDGIFTGIVRFYQDGRLSREYRVDARGNKDGRAREFAPDGTVLRDAVYADGNESGLVRVFHPDGTLRRAAFHGEGGRETASVEFTRAGRLGALRCADAPSLAPALDDARACGFAGGSAPVELFDDRGVVRQRVWYAGGKRTRWESLHGNGQPETLGETDGGRTVVRRFRQDGTPRHEVRSLQADGRTVRERESDYSDRGTLVRKQRWSPDGVLASDDRFYLNGQPRSRRAYGVDGGERFVDASEFHDNGKPARAGRFRVGARGGPALPTGIHREFREDGSLAAETSYDGRGRPARERAFGEDGTLLRDDEVFEDGSRKAFAR